MASGGRWRCYSRRLMDGGRAAGANWGAERRLTARTAHDALDHAGTSAQCAGRRFKRLTTRKQLVGAPLQGCPHTLPPRYFASIARLRAVRCRSRVVVRCLRPAGGHASLGSPVRPGQAFTDSTLRSAASPPGPAAPANRVARACRPRAAHARSA